MTEGGDIQTTPPFNETSVPGVFAVGDCATPLKAISQAVAMGCLTAVGVVVQLQAQPLPEARSRLGTVGVWFGSIFICS